MKNDRRPIVVILTEGKDLYDKTKRISWTEIFDRRDAVSFGDGGGFPCREAGGGRLPPLRGMRHCPVDLMLSALVKGGRFCALQACGQNDRYPFAAILTAGKDLYDAIANNEMP